MQAIVKRLEGLPETLRYLNYERLFVVSVLVATLTGSLYVYLVDFYFARSPDQPAAADPLVADRVAPIGRVTLAEPVVAVPAPAAIATDTSAGESATVESSADGDVAEVSASEAESNQTSAASASRDELRTDSNEGRPASADVPVQAAAPQATSSPATVAPPQAYPPVPPGYILMPAQGYAPVDPYYRPPAAMSRQGPRAPSWYAPGPYQAYPPSLYERSAVPPAGYPPPQGWMR